MLSDLSTLEGLGCPGTFCIFSALLGHYCCKISHYETKETMWSHLYMNTRPAVRRPLPNTETSKLKLKGRRTDFRSIPEVESILMGCSYKTETTVFVRVTQFPQRGL